MGRIAATALFPLIGVALGVGATAVLVWRGVDTVAAAAVGLAVFAAVLSVRTWRTSELERPLLADELLGLHDAVDALREETAGTRARMTELAEVLEEAVARGALEPDPRAGSAGLTGLRALRTLEARVIRTETAIERLSETLTAPEDAPDGLTAPDHAEPPLPEPASAPALLAAPPIAPAAVAAPAETIDAIPAPPIRPAGGEGAAPALFTPEKADTELDLSLQPIISLADREPRYFETLVDTEADPAAAVVKAAAVARRLSAAGQETAVICRAPVGALRDGAMLRDFLRFTEEVGETWPGLTASLRLAFAQGDLDIGSDRDLTLLKKLRDAGYAFSMDRVDDLSIDIARLARAGFRMVKLDVGLVLARERATGDGGVAQRLVATLDRAGLELVLENLDRVETVRAAREAGARLGQGEAIAPPRLAAVESAWLRAADNAAVLGPPRPRPEAHAATA